MSRITPLRKATAALVVGIASSLIFAATAFGTYSGPASFTSYSGNPSCNSLGYAYSVRVEAPAGDQYPASGTYTQGPLTVTFTVNPADPISFDFSSNQLIETVLVKAGSSGYRYAYAPGVSSDTGLQSPKSDGISHIEFCYGRPTAVRMQSLNAHRTARGVVVSWRTAAEVDTVGYNVYRQVAGKRVRVNSSLIPATGAHLYRLLDRQATGGAARYWIQDVSTSGARVWHGPAQAR